MSESDERAKRADVVERTATRVALISSSYHPYPGGVEEHTRNVARELKQSGHAVVVWTVDRGEHLGVQVVDGIEVRYLPAPLPAGNVTAIVRFACHLPQAWSTWMAALRAFSPDVLHVQCFGPNGLYALALHGRTRVPLVVSAHGETFMDHGTFRDSWLLRVGLRRAISAAAVVTGCSQMVLEDLRSRFGLTAGVVVPNGVDLEEAARLDLSGSQGTSDVPTIFSVGRAVRVKGFDLLIRAFAEANLPPGTQLVIGGDGPERANLEELIAALGLSDRVTLTGRLDRGQVIRGMAEADVVVVPSRVEAFGIVVLEAWRSGTALVATSRGGPADLVTSGVDGILVDPRDVGALAEVLSELMADRQLRERVGAAGLQRVTEFTWTRVAQAYEEVYRLAQTTRRVDAARLKARKDGE